MKILDWFRTLAVARQPIRLLPFETVDLQTDCGFVFTFVCILSPRISIDSFFVVDILFSIFIFFHMRVLFGLTDVTTVTALAAAELGALNDIGLVFIRTSELLFFFGQWMSIHFTVGRQSVSLIKRRICISRRSYSCSSFPFHPNLSSWLLQINLSPLLCTWVLDLNLFCSWRCCGSLFGWMFLVLVISADFR